MKKDFSEIMEFLEDLQTRRFNMESLESELNTFFDYEGKLLYDDEIDELVTDFRFLYSKPYEDLNLDIEIYFLIMRAPGFDGSDVYITETLFEIQ